MHVLFFVSVSLTFGWYAIFMLVNSITHMKLFLFLTAQHRDKNQKTRDCLLHFYILFKHSLNYICKHILVIYEFMQICKRRIRFKGVKKRDTSHHIEIQRQKRRKMSLLFNKYLKKDTCLHWYVYPSCLGLFVSLNLRENTDTTRYTKTHKKRNELYLCLKALFNFYFLREIMINKCVVCVFVCVFCGFN